MNKIIEFLVVSSFFYNFASGLLGPIYAIFVEQIGGDILTAGSAFAIYTIICGVLILLLGKWENRAKHKEKILVLSRVFTLIGFTGYLFVTNPIQLFLVQITLGAALAFGTPAFDTIYSKNLDKNKEAFEWGAWEGMYQIALGLSAIAGAIIVEFFGFRTLFVIMVWFAIFSLLAMIWMAIQKQFIVGNATGPNKRKNWVHNSRH
jgi:MFS family permease